MEKRTNITIRRRTFTCLVFLLAGYASSLTAQLNFSWAEDVGSMNGDAVRDMARASNGDLLLTGSFFGTLDFDPSSSTDNLSSLGGSPDAYIARYDTTGQYQWAMHMGGDLPTFAQQIEVDAAGNIYILGEFQDTIDLDPSSGVDQHVASGSFGLFLAKYDSNGNHLWGISMGGPAVNFSHGLAVDNAGNAFITGYFIALADMDPGPGSAMLMGVNGSPDVFLAKYDSSGNYLWAHNIGSPALDEGRDVAVDANGDVYVTGYIQGDAALAPGDTLSTHSSSKDGFIAKYSAAGSYQWAYTLGGAAPDEGRALTIDPNGYVYVGGVFQGTANFDPSGLGASFSSAGDDDLFLARFDTAGNYSWSARAGAHLEDFVTNIQVDQSGGAWLTGGYQDSVQFDSSGVARSVVSQGGTDIFVAGYDSSGVSYGASSMGGPVDDEGRALSIDPNGDVYAAGVYGNVADLDPTPGTATFTAGGNGNFFFGKYPRCQSQQFTVADTICVGDSYAFGSVTLDTAGRYTGVFAGSNGCDSTVMLDLAVVKPDTSVTRNNVTLTAAAGASYQWLDCDSSYAAISGETMQTFTPSVNGNYAVEITTPRGCVDTSECIEINNIGLNEFDASKAAIALYPNPSHDGVFNCEVFRPVHFQVYSAEGQMLMEQKMTKGKHKLDLSQQAPGVYYLREVGSSGRVTSMVISR